METMTKRPDVCDCGHVPTETTGCGTGYATTITGVTMCYACGDDRPGERVTLYVSSDGRHVVTWSGGRPPVVVNGGGLFVPMCCACADDRQRFDVKGKTPGERVTLYVSSDGKRVTTWSGGHVMKVCRWGALHHWSRERKYLHAVDESDRVWYGTGAPGMWTTLTLTRDQVTR